MIIAGVWLSRSGRAWSCQDCDQSPELRRRRGNCGVEPFGRGLPHLRDGRVPGYRIAPDSDPEFAEESFDRCPVAGSMAFADIYQIYRALKVDGLTLGDLIRRPTSGLVEALSALGHSSRLAHQRDMEAAHGDPS